MTRDEYRQDLRRIAQDIKALKRTRDKYEEYLKPIETRTRQLLIDPMLETLGWNVRDPAQVHLEYQATSGKPDYALFSHDGNVVALIEAKNLKEELGPKQVEQVLKYASDKTLNNFLKYVVCTNGDHWQIWPVKGGEVSFQISNMHESECAGEAGLLLRSALEAEERGASSPAPAQTQPPTPEQANNGDWVQLTALLIKKGEKPPPGTNIKFPDSSTRSLKSWTDLFAAVAEYLVKKGKISKKDCPVRKKESAITYLVHTEPTHQNDSDFHSKREIGNGLWLNTNFNPTNNYKNACWLLENFGIDPSTVLVTNPS